MYAESAKHEWIKYFSLGNFSNTSTKSDFQGYENHTDKVIEVIKGETYSISMEAGLGLRRFRKLKKLEFP